ncbi:MAG: hypothetical protein KME43_05495 [Myxacorys chilensis ATA2-1-KO14]|nr:hypothetical protein [Myxacorys chilensis ATA2-1-KO14]
MVNFAPQSAEPISTSQLQGDPAVARSTSERHPPSIFAGTSQGLYILDSEPRLELEENSITALAIQGRELWVISAERNSEGTVAHKAVWQRSAEGEWLTVASENQHRFNCLLPIDQTILIGTSEAHLMQIRNGTIQYLDSFDHAEGRKAWYTPWGGAPDVRSLAASSSDDLYVNVHVGGILRSQDQGQSWQPTLDLHADVHEVKTIAERPNLVLAATAEGLAWSEDHGESWQFNRANLHATYARAIALCSDNSEVTILMSVSLGPRGGKAALYRRSLNQPGTFEKCHQGLPEWFSDNINTGCLTAWGNWVVFGTQTGQLFRSHDAGLTWEPIASGLAPISCLSLASPRG